MPDLFLFVPSGVEHQQGNVSGRPLRFLAQFSPSGFERFFFGRQKLEELYGVDTPDYLQEIEMLAAGCYLAILGPPPVLV